MDTDRFFTVSTSPSHGNAPRSIQFFDSYEIAVEHARRISKDLGRDVFIGELKASFYGARKANSEWKTPPVSAEITSS